MKCYQIQATLVPCKETEITDRRFQYVVVLSRSEWQQNKELFDVGIDMESDMNEILVTEANVNYDSVTGTFSIPRRSNVDYEDKFAFVLDEKGIVFISEDPFPSNIIEFIAAKKRWRSPSLERFIYDFLSRIIGDDLRLMEQLDNELDRHENAILNDEGAPSVIRANEIRGIARTLKNHYDQLTDLGQLFTENENRFFRHENLRYFHTFLNKIDRLHDKAQSLDDYTAQILDLYSAHLEIKQNRIIQILTIVTTVLMPVTVVTGWFGMNFANMPELNTAWGYPACIALCIALVVLTLLFFKRKRWL